VGALLAEVGESACARANLVVRTGIIVEDGEFDDCAQIFDLEFVNLVVPLGRLTSAVEMLRFDGLALHLEDDVWVHLADPLGVARQLRAVDVQLERAQAVIVVALRLLTTNGTQNTPSIK